MGGKRVKKDGTAMKGGGEGRHVGKGKVSRRQEVAAGCQHPRHQDTEPQVLLGAVRREIEASVPRGTFKTRI